MKLFGLFGKEKPVDFDAFRDMVRLAVRREKPGSDILRTENGFTIHLDGNPITCNLRGLYATYNKTPGDRQVLIQHWIASLVTEVPEHTWSEAVARLRPMLKNANYIAQAQTAMQRQSVPDTLPSIPFAGELSVILMRDLPGTAAAVTQRNLDDWGVTLERAMTEAVNNMSLTGYPTMVNALLAGGTGRKGMPGEEVGMVFEGDHLTATWLTQGRFRDFVGQRLQGNFVVSTPNRSKLVAVRADEPGLIASIQAANRSLQKQSYALTSQCYLIDTSITGGIVSVYQAGGLAGESVDPNSVFARGGSSAMPLLGQPSPPAPSGAYQRPGAVDFSAWNGLTESTGDRSES